MKRKNRRSSGFTLLEVLLVLAILVVMGSTVTYYFVGAQQKANKRQAKSQISMFEGMLTAYHMDVGSYPSDAQGLSALRQPPPELASTGRWEGPYAEKDIPLDPWGHEYQYRLLGVDEFGGMQYQIISFGADGQEGGDDDVSNQ